MSDFMATASGDLIAPLLDYAPGIEGAFPADFPELDCPVRIEGDIPEFVHGVYYLNGPARFGRDDFKYNHWLDGDGMVCSLRFTRGGAHLRSRYVRSRKFSEENQAGRPLFRAFGTSFDGSRLNQANNGLESPVNVSIYPFHDHLLAFGEQGLPWELDSETLETSGLFTFNGRLNGASPLSAHPKFDADSGEMFNFGIFFSEHSPKLYFYCFGSDGLRYRKAVALDYPCSVHDFIISRHYAAFFLSPYILDVANMLRSGDHVMGSLSWQPELGSRIMVVSRRTGELAASIPVGEGYCLHLINSFEEGDNLVVDVVRYQEPVYRHYQTIPDLFRDVSMGGPVSFCLDLKANRILRQTAIEYLQAPDFPAIDPRFIMRCYRDFWMLGISTAGKPGRKFFDQLVHASWDEALPQDVYQCPPMFYLCGEPVFVPGPDHERGVVLCQEFDAGRRLTSFALFDAFDVKAGPIARMAVEAPVHLGFHAVFQGQMAP